MSASGPLDMAADDAAGDAAAVAVMVGASAAVCS